MFVGIPPPIHTHSHTRPLIEEHLEILIALGALGISASHYKKGGNEKSDRRLEVVKVLTALKCCFGGSFVSVFPQPYIVIYSLSGLYHLRKGVGLITGICGL